MIDSLLACLDWTFLCWNKIWKKATVPSSSSPRFVPFFPLVLFLLSAAALASGQQACDVPGVCVDAAIGAETAGSRDDCLQRCKDVQVNNKLYILFYYYLYFIAFYFCFQGCQYWSFDATDGFCSLHDACTGVDDTQCQGTCLSGSVDCLLYDDERRK